MGVSDFIESVGRRSEKTVDSCQRGLDLFALCHDVASPDLLVVRVKARELNQYQLLDKFISFLDRRLRSEEHLGLRLSRQVILWL